MTISSTYIIK